MQNEKRHYSRTLINFRVAMIVNVEKKELGDGGGQRTSLKFFGSKNCDVYVFHK
jgi:hypothetical protein